MRFIKIYDIITLSNGKGETAMSEKEYWTIRIVIALKDRLYDIADEMGCDIGEVLNRCLECGLKHQNEWAKPKGERK